MIEDKEKQRQLKYTYNLRIRVKSHNNLTRIQVNKGNKNHKKIFIDHCTLTLRTEDLCLG